jgi:hypothetical protein
MYHYDPNTALIELTEEGVLPNPVYLRDMIFRTRLGTQQSIQVNRALQDYMKHFGEAMNLARRVLEELSRSDAAARGH